MNRYRNSQRRRGVLLLVILGILVLMTTMGVAFIMFSQQFRTSMRTEVLQDQHAGHDVKKQIDTVIFKLIRDEPTTNFTSVMYGQSLLEDMYGSEFPSLNAVRANFGGGPAWVDDSTPGPPAQPISHTLFYIPLNQNANGAFDFDGSGSGILSPLTATGYLNGLILTIRDGDLAGQSTRIVGFMPINTPVNGLPNRLIVKAFTDKPQQLPTSANTFCINGRPFNGTGAGLAFFNSANTALDFNDRGAYTAPATLALGTTLTPPAGTVFVGGNKLNTLLQNYTPFSGYGTTSSPINVYIPSPMLPNYTSQVWQADYGGVNRATNHRDFGGMDEGYDAPDLQNMFLGHLETNATGAVTSVLPSFHRPELIAYLSRDANAYPLLYPTVLNPSTIAVRNKLWRSIMLRPNQFDHPKFTGSNPNFNVMGNGFSAPQMQTGTRPATPWWSTVALVASDGAAAPLPPTEPRVNCEYDVDNDGDGIKDSVWIDVGLPVQTLSDGRKVKPLAAILCLDMDGRLNLNAHGTYAQALRQANTFYSTTSDQRLLTTTTSAIATGPVSPSQADLNMIPGNWLVHNPVPVGGQTKDATLNRANELAFLPMGSGYGVADISLANLFAAGTTNYLGFLAGTSGYEGRYGEYATATRGSSSGFGADPFNDAGTGYPYPLPGATRQYRVNLNNISRSDRLSRGEHYQIPGSSVATSPWGNYSTPWDFSAQLCCAIDLAGHPVYIQPNYTSNARAWRVWGDSWSGTDVSADANIFIYNNPYTLDLSRSKVRSASASPTTAAQALANEDNPFSVGEIEHLLRLYDYDASQLPDRLTGLLGATSTGLSTVRSAVTTESMDVPSPAMKPTADMLAWANAYYAAAQLALPPTFVSNLSQTDRAAVLDVALRVRSGQISIEDMLIYRLHQVWKTAGAVAMTLPESIVHRADGTFQVGGTTLLPADVIAGLRFDLNRPFGNGVNDAAANSTVDEPDEEQAVGTDPNKTDPRWSQLMNKTYGSSSLTWCNEAANTRFSSLAQRQEFARGLYILAMLCVEDNFNQWIPATVDPTFDGLTAAQKREVIARRIAQWAVNVVDYRDNDSIMTPFFYDANPFNGWGQPADMRVVVGCEAPDLLITETLATHDFRIADTNSGSKYINDPMSPDPDGDQIRMPQGSLFVELRCVRNGNGSEKLPPELYTYDATATAYRLNLSAVAPGSFSVWRMMVVKIPGSTIDLNSATSPITSSWLADLAVDDTVTPPRMSTQIPITGTTPPTFNVSRIIWLGNGSTPVNGNPNDKYVYYNRSGSVLVTPGQSAIIGPRAVTYFGRMMQTLGSPTNHFTSFAAESQQRIDLSAFNYQWYKVANTPDSRLTGLAAPVSMICAGPPMNSINAWTSGTNWGQATPKPAEANNGVGMNVSEPLWSLAAAPSGGPMTTTNYYSEPNVKDTRTMNWDCYGDFGANKFPDKPYDLNNLAIDKSITSGIRPNFAAVLLQRLANPLIAFQPNPGLANYNPYITVDYQAIDLICFSGECEREDKPSGGDPTDLGWDYTTAAPVGYPANSFQSRARGLNAASNANEAKTNIWSPKSAAGNTALGAPDNQTAFGFNLNATLGFLNPEVIEGTALFKNTGTLKVGDGGSLNAAGVATPNYQGYPDSSENTPAGTVGRTFPWLPWANRPLISAAEIMNVPTSSPSRLCYEFSEDAIDDPSASRIPANNVYDATHSAAANRPVKLGNYLSFFWSNQNNVNAPNLSRLLDLVHVPTRFVGFNEWINPQVGYDLNTAVSQYKAPYNYFPSYREPGRININTIGDPRVWTGITNNYTGGTPWTAAAFLGAAQYTGSNGAFPESLVAMRSDLNGFSSTSKTSANHPTGPDASFGNPFRSGQSDEYTLPGAIHNNNTGPAEQTILRSDWNVTGGIPSPWLTYTPGTAIANATDPNRNPYFYFQNFQRMSNLVTTRSNVFAVWVTVGYFEVEPVTQQKIIELNGAVDSAGNQIDTVSTVYPDGYMLGQELGADTGEFTRHRGFYIIDRTIPVGYVRGEDVNVDKTILLRRIIQ